MSHGNAGTGIGTGTGGMIDHSAATIALTGTSSTAGGIHSNHSGNGHIDIQHGGNNNHLSIGNSTSTESKMKALDILRTISKPSLMRIQTSKASNEFNSNMKLTMRTQMSLNEKQANSSADTTTNEEPLDMMKADGTGNTVITGGRPAAIISMNSVDQTHYHQEDNDKIFQGTVDFNRQHPNLVTGLTTAINNNNSSSSSSKSAAVSKRMSRPGGNRASRNNRGLTMRSQSGNGFKSNSFTRTMIMNSFLSGSPPSMSNGGGSGSGQNWLLMGQADFYFLFLLQDEVCSCRSSQESHSDQKEPLRPQIAPGVGGVVDLPADHWRSVATRLMDNIITKRIDRSTREDQQVDASLWASFYFKLGDDIFLFLLSCLLLNESLDVTIPAGCEHVSASFITALGTLLPAAVRSHVGIPMITDGIVSMMMQDRYALLHIDRHQTFATDGTHVPLLLSHNSSWNREKQAVLFGSYYGQLTKPVPPLQNIIATTPATVQHSHIYSHQHHNATGISNAGSASSAGSSLPIANANTSSNCDREWRSVYDCLSIKRQGINASGSTVAAIAAASLLVQTVSCDTELLHQVQVPPRTGANNAHNHFHGAGDYKKNYSLNFSYHPLLKPELPMSYRMSTVGASVVNLMADSAADISPSRRMRFAWSCAVSDIESGCVGLLEGNRERSTERLEFLQQLHEREKAIGLKFGDGMDDDMSTGRVSATTDKTRVHNDIFPPIPARLRDEFKEAMSDINACATNSSGRVDKEITNQVRGLLCKLIGASYLSRYSVSLFIYSDGRVSSQPQKYNRFFESSYLVSTDGEQLPVASPIHPEDVMVVRGSTEIARKLLSMASLTASSCNDNKSMEFDGTDTKIGSQYTSPVCLQTDQSTLFLCLEAIRGLLSFGVGGSIAGDETRNFNSFTGDTEYNNGITADERGFQVIVFDDIRYLKECCESDWEPFVNRFYATRAFEVR